MLVQSEYEKILRQLAKKQDECLEQMEKIKDQKSAQEASARLKSLTHELAILWNRLNDDLIVPTDEETTRLQELYQDVEQKRRRIQEKQTRIHALALPAGSPGPALISNPFGPDRTVTLKIANIPSAAASVYVRDKLQKLTDAGSTPFIHSVLTGDILTVTFAPVSDPKGLANRIDFGKIMKVEGRVIHIAAHRIDVPPAPK